MTHRITTFVTAFAITAFLLFVTVVASASGARALTSNGHGAGYLSNTGWWLGSYSLDDGSRGFCLQAGRPSPIGHLSDYVDGDTLGWFTPDQAAKLAYISRSWAATTDRTTAAAGQIATWMISGLNGKTPEAYAERAGADAAVVLARARAMLDQAEREASRGVTATTTIELSETGAGRMRVDLAVGRLSGEALATPGAQSGRVELTGARFADGTDTAEVQNGVDLPIVPTGTASTVTVSARATFASLPYGSQLRVAVPRNDAQAVLVAIPASAGATASADHTGASPLPFQPRVSTVTSAATATPGSTVTDHLTVDVELQDDLLPTWAVYETADGFEPVTAVIESRLLGPIAGGIRPAPTVPVDAPVVCTVEVVVTGPGEYETPPCTLTVPGDYVWVEIIDPARTPADQGGTRMRPWKSSFGVASEITRVPAPPTTAAATELADTGSAPAGGVWAGVAAVVGGSAVAALAAVRNRRTSHASKRVRS
ncbi:hypothetical protein [Leifsonia poae]|uniref:hypothetical protein n=1 Tax=Leifsonia poae TaxID=110933 RepID=UPI001CC11707|nr:hypothetical protein [Leifsonia poae]